MKNLICFDNNGESFDQYTILDKKTGEMIGTNDHPFHPMGFGQFVGNVADNYYRVTFGAGWHRVDKKLLNKRIKFAVDHFLNDCAHIGKIVPFKSLPADVQKFAIQSLIDKIETDPF